MLPISNVNNRAKGVCGCGVRTHEEQGGAGWVAAVKLLTCANLAITMEFIAQLRPFEATEKGQHFVRSWGPFKEKLMYI